ncbi:MAG: hypothetical protein R6V19_16810 [Armatimonadota bacterium]
MSTLSQADGTIERVGVPIRAVVYGNSHGVVVGDEAQTFYIPYFSNTGGALVGCNTAPGEVFDVPLGSSGGYGLCPGGDGALYIGGVNPGDIYRYDPETQSLDTIGGSEFGNTYVWDTVASPDGNKIYGACYPTAGVLEYDIETSEMRFIGPIREGIQYARSIAVDADGNVWVGGGTQATLVVIDPATGEMQSVLPPEYDANMVYSLRRHGPYMCASVLFENHWLLYDTESREIVQKVPNPDEAVWMMHSRGGDEGTFYLYSFPNGDLYSYAPQTQAYTLHAERLGQCAVVTENRWAHCVDDQSYVLYDLEQGREITRSKLAQATDGMNIMDLAASPKGHIFGATYINMHMFGYRPESGELHDLGKVSKWGGQVDSMSCGRDGKIYMGAYVMAVVNVYDPSVPWRPGEDPGANPRCLGSIGHGQYRTRCNTLGPDGMIYMGSIPSYGSAPKGAFSRIDPDSGEATVWTDLVAEGAVHKCDSDDRYVYAAGSNEFFVWDPFASEKAHSIEMRVTALACEPSGGVIGTSNAELFKFSPDTMEITRTVEAPTGDCTEMTLAPNGMLYGLNDDSIIEIAPDTLETRIIADEGGQFLAADADSNLYFARGAQLWRFLWQ